jgi:hypothetical protein
MSLVRNIRIGLPTKQVTVGEAVHFLKASLHFLSTYKDFRKVQRVTFELDPAWRCSFMKDTQYRDGEIMQKFSDVLESYTVNAKVVELVGGDKEQRTALKGVLRTQASKGIKVEQVDD